MLVPMLWLTVVASAGMVGAVGLRFIAAQARSFLTAGTVGPGEQERLRFGALAARSVVHATDGSVLQLVHAEENRVPIPLARVPGHVIDSVLAAEDERFFIHGALDPRAMARALVVDVTKGGIFEGGSTITQQLVKTELLTPRQDLGRKVREAALSIRLEKQMSKDQILERYLNSIYFGNGAYGLQAAAERYFSTDVDQLTRPQGALLAGLIRNPVGADPFTRPEAAALRRATVADQLLRLGRVTPEGAAAIRADPLPTQPPPQAVRGADYFLDEVVEGLLADSRLGATEADRYQAVYRGGLIIHTTLDPRLQKAAEEAVARISPDSGGRFNMALASVEPASGALRALVGGRDFGRSRFNLATDGDGRQAGSSFKPFTLVAALEAGLTPDDLISGFEPCPVANPGGEPDPWVPGNVEGQGVGILSLADATVSSVNCAYARLVKVVGPDKVVGVAKRLGVTNHLDPHLSITLGSQGVTAVEMAAAYATLAADGNRRPPYLVERVTDASGRVLIEGRPEATRVLEARHARVANQVLSETVSRGTGRAAAVRGWTVAGKTGSTDNNADAWFVGYTPALSTAVWMGSPEGRVPMLNVGGVPRVYGGTFPARVFSAYMSEALAGRPVERFALPEGVGAQPVRFISPPGEGEVEATLANLEGYYDSSDDDSYRRFLPEGPVFVFPGGLSGGPGVAFDPRTGRVVDSDGEAIGRSGEEDRRQSDESQEDDPDDGDPQEESRSEAKRTKDRSDSDD
ncbi:MAG: transglycosylase domain-containing protein [Acidimicrobiales bacterium]